MEFGSRNWEPRDVVVAVVGAEGDLAVGDGLDGGRHGLHPVCGEDPRKNYFVHG